MGRQRDQRPRHVAAGPGHSCARPPGHRLAARHRAHTRRTVPAGADPRPGGRGGHRPVRPAPPDDCDQPVPRGCRGRDAARHRSRPLLGTVCRPDRREQRRRAVPSGLAGSHAGPGGHRAAAEQRQLAQRPSRRRRAAHRRAARRHSPGRLRRPVPDLRRRAQLPGGRGRQRPDVAARPNVAARRDDRWPHRHDHRGGPRPARRRPRPACSAGSPGPASGHGHLPGRERLAERHAHPARDPAAGRRRKHRIRTIRARRRIPARRSAPARPAGPRPAAHAADRYPGRHRRRAVRPVHLDLAGHRSTRRGRHRHVRLDVRGHPADRHAARHPQRGPRPDQRRLPDRRGRGRPGRRRGRALPGPGAAPGRTGRRGQPGHTRRGRADTPVRASDGAGGPGTRAAANEAETAARRRRPGRARSRPGSISWFKPCPKGFAARAGHW